MKAMPSNSNCRNTGALFSCKVCRRTFNTERALLEHDRDTTKHEPQLRRHRMFPLIRTPMRRSKTLDQVFNGYYNSVFNESTNGLAEWPSGKPGACYRDVLGEVTSEDTWRRHMKFAEVLGAAISKTLFESNTTSGPLEDRGVQSVCTNYALDRGCISAISREIVESETTSGPLEDCNVESVCTNYALGRGSISEARKRICNRPIVRPIVRANEETTSCSKDLQQNQYSFKGNVYNLQGTSPPSSLANQASGFVRDEFSATEEAADSCPICHHGLSHTCLWCALTWCETCQANQQEQYSASDVNGSCPVCLRLVNVLVGPVRRLG